MVNAFPNSFWLRLDNAAKLYPAVKNNELTSVFRITADLKEPVQIIPLKEALKVVEQRFPYFKVNLKIGFFWYYLEFNDQPVTLVPDLSIPCRAFLSDELLLRVLVKGKRVNVEFSHILTDGAGAFEFLKELLIIYFERCGLLVSKELTSFRLSPEIGDDEIEDAYNRYFKRVDVPPFKGPKAFHLPFSLNKSNRFSLLIAVLPIDKILEKARENNVSITDYLISIYLFALQEIYEQLSFLKRRGCNKILRIQVPINLRKIFPSATMRNFSLFVMPGIDLRLGHFTFEEITKSVYHQMQLETDKKLINKIISRNVGGERNNFVRGMPLFLKSIMLSHLYRQGANQYSGVITNYGRVNFPAILTDNIQRFIFIPPPPNKLVKINCGVVGLNNELVLSFGSIVASRELERRFLSLLTRQGIPVKIIN